MLSFLASSLLHLTERDALIDCQLTSKLIKLLLEERPELSPGLHRVFEHLSAPVLVDHAQILEVQLLNHQDSKLVVTVLQEQFDNVLGFEDLELLVGDRSCEVG